jgi:iron complex transport system substrate-binding protein
VLALVADCVLTTDSRAADAAHERLREVGVRVVALDTSTLDGVFVALDRIGAVFERAERAASLARDMRERLAVIETRAAGLPRRRVLVAVGRDPLYVAGPGSHLDAMIRTAGGENVAADAGSPYARLSLEAVLERGPEVIVDISDNRPDAPRGQIAASWDRWPFLPAVRDGRVYHVDPARLAIPGLRLPEMTRLLAQLIHPETFGEPDLGAPAR